LRDPRAEALAKILVGYSTEVKEGEVVSIDGESAAEPLLLAVYDCAEGPAQTRFRHLG